MNVKKITKALIVTSLASFPLAAQELEISVTNLTHGSYFTPLLIAAHSSDSHLFQSGEMASLALQQMAEGGDISALDAAVMGDDGVTVANPAAGLLAPSSQVSSIMLDTGTQTHLSIVAMLLPTNDGFVGLDSWKIPTQAGSYSLMLNAYDAGTEANDEIINGGGMTGVPGIPAAPGGDGGTNGSGVADTGGNDRVHIHPGVLGDTDPQAGMSDIDSRIHRWLNPVARVTVVVK